MISAYRKPCNNGRGRDYDLLWQVQPGTSSYHRLLEGRYLSPTFAEWAQINFAWKNHLVIEKIRTGAVLDFQF